MGMCGEQGDVSYEIMREVGGKNSGRFVPVFKSPNLKNTKNPTWPMHKMRFAKFANGDAMTRIKFRLLVADTFEAGHIITTTSTL